MLLCSKQRVIFRSLSPLPAIKKNVLLALLLSNVAYNVLCHCDSRYVDRTFQRLQDRIRQHVPKLIRTGQILNSRNLFANLQPPSCIVNPQLLNIF